MGTISLLFGYLWLLSMFVAAIALIVWIVLLIIKNKKKKIAKRIFWGAIGGTVLSMIIGVATYQECEHNWRTFGEQGSRRKVCSICGEAIFLKQSPVTVIGMKNTINSVGGVEWTFKIKNNSDKEIKYITFQWSCYNAVGDSISDQITGKSYVRVIFTGPLAPGKTTDWNRNTTLFYNHTYNNMKWNEITVEYMDGTTEKIGENYEGYQR